MSQTNTLAIFVILCCVISFAFASDPDAAQDLYVRVNGFPCKEWSSVTEADFFFDGLAKDGDITNSFGSVVTSANVKTTPGVNTFGISLARTIRCWIHHKLQIISESIKKGEIFVFPKGLVHYLKSTGDKPASVLSAFSSQLQHT